MKLEHLLTPSEVAKMLKISRRTLANWRTLETGPRFTKMPNGRIYYPEQEVRAYLEQDKGSDTMANTRLVPLSSLLVLRGGAHIL